jgi:hypothetical protein
MLDLCILNTDMNIIFIGSYAFAIPEQAQKEENVIGG